MSVLRGGRRTEGGGHGPENRQGASDRKEERRGGCAARLTRSNTLPAPTRTRPTLAGFLGVLPASAPNRVIPSRPVPAHTPTLTSPRSLSPSLPRVCASPPNPRPSNEPHSTRTSPVPPHRPPHAPNPLPPRPSILPHRQRRLRRQQEVQPQADGQQVPSIERSRRCQCAECISKS